MAAGLDFQLMAGRRSHPALVYYLAGSANFGPSFLRHDGGETQADYALLLASQH